MKYTGTNPSSTNRIASGSLGVFVENTRVGTFGTDSLVVSGSTLISSSLKVIGTQSLTGSLNISGSVVIDGILFATEKSFNIVHPTQPNKRLVYGVLEGPEHAVYVRGRTSHNIIELPEEWVGLVDESTITVQLTPVGTYQSVYVDTIKNNKVYIKSEDFLDCFYLIYGERKDINKLQTIQ
jgi:hypothetical protein